MNSGNLIKTLTTFVKFMAQATAIENRAYLLNNKCFTKKDNV